MIKEEWGEFGYWIWIVFPVSLIVIFGGIIFFIVYFFRLARKRDKEQELHRSRKVRMDSDENSKDARSR